jgi:hypothetical protein
MRAIKGTEVVGRGAALAFLLVWGFCFVPRCKVRGREEEEGARLQGFIARDVALLHAQRARDLRGVRKVRLAPLVRAHAEVVCDEVVARRAAGRNK